MNKSKFRRLSVLLDKQTSNLLESYAQKTGTSKAKIIINWIKTSSKISLSNNDQIYKKTVNFNFRIKEIDYKKLQRIIFDSRLNISEIIRSLIIQNTKKDFTIIQKPKMQESKIKHLWLTGNLSEINNIYTGNIHDLSINDTITYIQASTELGNLNNSIEGIDILKWKATTNDLKEKIDLISKVLYMDIKLCKRDIVGIDEDFAEINSFKNLHDNKGILGLHTIHKGEIASYQENFQESITHYKKAIEILGKNYPTLRIRSHIRLAKIYMNELNESMAKISLNKASEISKSINNEFFESWINSDRGLIDLRNGKFTEAKNKVLKTIDISKKHNNAKEIYYSLDHYARILWQIGEEDNAYKVFSEAEVYEMRFRKSDQFSITRLHKYYVESKYNYQASLNKIKEHNYKTECHFYSSIGKYILNLTKLNNVEDYNEGIRGLKELQYTTKNLQIKQSAKKSIESGGLNFIR